MTALDNRTSGDDERWCLEQRARIAEYLNRQGVNHGRIGEWPAWHVSPYVSLWAVESVKSPGWVGWWAICGDLPTDYISSDGIRDPRNAMRAIAQRWLEVSTFVAQGDSHPTIRIGAQSEQAELAVLLESRAKVMLQWVDDDKCWDREPD